MTKEQLEEFETVVRPVMNWLSENYHPNVTLIIEPTQATLNEGLLNFTTLDFIRD